MKSSSITADIELRPVDIELKDALNTAETNKPDIPGKAPNKSATKRGTI